MFGEEVHSDRNGDKCTFTKLVAGSTVNGDSNMLLLNAKKDFDVDPRTVIGPTHTIFDLEKFLLMLNVFD